MTEPNPRESVPFILGEMRADLKYLVNERRLTSERISAIEAGHVAATADHHERISKLEHFKTRIGVLTAALGVAVPSAITVFAHRMGLI